MNPLPVVVYGSLICEDTALVTARLRALGVPFTVRYNQQDAEVNAILEKHNNGNHVTPTLIFGDDAIVMAEPTLEQLESSLAQAGYVLNVPKGVEIRGELKNQRVPNFTLASSDGTDLTLYKLPRRKRAVLLFVPDPRDRAAQGYVRQLTRERELYDEYNALPIPILSADAETVREWANEFARGYAALSDEDGVVKAKYDRVFGLENANVLLVILDTFCVPRVISYGADAGALIAPGEVLSWLRLLDYECDE